MKRALIVLIAVVALGCSKEEPTQVDNPPPDTSSSVKFKCKINGVEMIADTAYGAYGSIGVTNRMQISGLKMDSSGDFAEHAISLLLTEPDYKGVGTYTIAVVKPDPFNPAHSIGYSHFTSIAVATSYLTESCWLPGLGLSGTAEITKDHNNTSVSGTFSGWTCFGDSAVHITDGIFNDVVLL